MPTAFTAARHGKHFGAGACNGSTARALPCGVWRYRCMRPTTRCATSWCRLTGNIRSRNYWRPASAILNLRRVISSPSNMSCWMASMTACLMLVNWCSWPAISPCKFNLIPFNPFPNSGYERSSPEAVARFRDVLDAGWTGNNSTQDAWR